jgi:hypothetical protein
MNIKKFYIISLSLVSVAMLDAAVGISGTSLSNATGLSAGEVGVYVTSDGTAFSGISIAIGADILDSATYGAGFAVLGSNTAASGFGSTTLASGHGADFSFAGDSFALFVFESSTTTAVASDVYNVWSDASWALPSADGVSAAFSASPTGTQIQQLSGASTFSGSVVPEPSTFAALAGLCALGAVMVRRRRA